MITILINYFAVLQQPHYSKLIVRMWLKGVCCWKDIKACAPAQGFKNEEILKMKKYFPKRQTSGNASRGNHRMIMARLYTILQMLISILKNALVETLPTYYFMILSFWLEKGQSLVCHTIYVCVYRVLHECSGNFSIITVAPPHPTPAADAHAHWKELAYVLNN